jgi:hypothetical protein
MSSYPQAQTVIQGQVIDPAHASFGCPVNHQNVEQQQQLPLPPPQPYHYDHSLNSPFPFQQQQQPHGMMMLPNNVVIVQVAPPPNGNQYYGGGINTNNHFIVANIQGEQGAGLTIGEQERIFELLRNAHWVKCYFIVAIIFVILNAAFSGLWFILGALLLALIAYIGVRQLNTTVMAIGSMWWIVIVLVRILALVAVFVWFGGGVVDKIFGTAAVVVGLCIDAFFCYKYFVNIYNLLKEMSERMLEEARSFPANTCGCL